MASQGVTPSEPILAVVGPTASGKTELALRLARRLNGEIISADMGQMFKTLAAGTAKPKGKWSRGVYKVSGVPYHLVDILDPDQQPDAGKFAVLARSVIADVRRRGRRPILAGGTGLYLKALFEGLAPLPRSEPALRARLAKRSNESLYRELTRRDPEAAKLVPPDNPHRLVRALEVFILSGRPISALWKRSSARTTLEARYLGVQWPPEKLRERIRVRAESMFPKMLAEIRRLVPEHFTGSEPGFRCLGYPQAVSVTRGKMDRAAGLQKMIWATNHYAKRQRTWFRNQTPVRWLTPAEARRGKLPWSA